MNTKHRKIKLILRYFHGSKRYFLCAIFASLTTTALNAVTPQIFRFTIDQVLGGGGYEYLREHLWILSLGIVAVSALSGMAMFVSRTCTAHAGENFAKNMRDSLFAHVQRLPMSWHDQNQTGDIIQRCTSDVEVIRNFVVTQLLEVFRTVFLVSISFVMMVSMNIRLSVIVFIFVPVVAGYSAVFYQLIAKRFLKADEAEGELSTVVQENVTGVRVVRAFGREQFEMDRFREKNENFAKMWIHLGTLSGLYWGVGDLITGLQVVAVVVLGAAEAVYGNMSVGEFVAFASYNTVLVWPVRGLGRILSDMSKAGVSFERVDYIIHGQEENYSEKKIEQLERTPRETMYQKTSLPQHLDIVFSHVTFSYEQEKKVLNDISFSIPQGQTFGILGGTGSGKSTIVQLLTRLYELDKDGGMITIGGMDIGEIPLEWLRRKIGIVLQEPFLYSRTIKENIAVATPKASMEEIVQAAQTACIHDAIQNFADGYDTLVGERGVTLSGGQRQRVAIARMLLQKAPVLIFDDSLSAVDADTDFRIRRELKERVKGATIILISHRITTLMEADQILVLNEGRVEELGSHSQLIQNQGIYRQIYEIQMRQDDRKQVGYSKENKGKDNRTDAEKRTNVKEVQGGSI
ncbi:MAG: ABC transporter ATP-binding protein [Lachnospiraceae bacterium]|nr:ABC transporter ATP-binding protein [Lachnospiraceae bacterium]